MAADSGLKQVWMLYTFGEQMEDKYVFLLLCLSNEKTTMIKVAIFQTNCSNSLLSIPQIYIPETADEPSEILVYLCFSKRLLSDILSRGG